MNGRLRGVRIAFALCLITTASVFAAPPTNAAEVGFDDFNYSGSVTAPTGQKPQSKLWFADSIWWGSLYSTSLSSFAIHRYDWASHTWASTGTVIDERESSAVDTLWDGTKLYVTTGGASTTSNSQAIRLVRYSYDATTKTYSKDVGFPTIVSPGGQKSPVLAKDSLGRLWMTYTSGSKVWVQHTTVNDLTWTPKFAIPTPGANNTSASEISSVIPYAGDRIGVMWGNQITDTMYFATHLDSDPDNVWSEAIAYQSPEGADDHVNLAALVGDPSGQVFAAVKTSKDLANDTLIHVLVLHNGQNWTSHLFGTKGENHTRAIIQLDPVRRDAYVFASAPCCGGGTIYMKKMNLDNPVFPPGLGTPFISSTANPKLNNPSGTKQVLTTESGLLVIAGDDSTRNYAHNRIAFSGTSIDTTITSGPGSQSNSVASFTYSSTDPTATFQCSLDAGTFITCPAGGTTYSNLSNGSHQFRVVATGAAGTDLTPASHLWVADTVAPTVNATNPVAGAINAVASQVTATFSENVDPASVTANTFLLKRQSDNAPVSGAVSYNPATNVATFVPNTALEGVTAYTATLVSGVSGIHDTVSNALVSDHVWSFTTVSNVTALSEDFETGDLANWSPVVVANGGTAQVGAGLGRAETMGARFSALAVNGSRAYARKTLASPLTGAIFSSWVRFTESDNSAIAFMRLLDSSGNFRLVSLYRRGTSGRIQVHYNGTYFDTTAIVPVDTTYRKFTVRMIANGSGASSVQVFVNELSVYSVSNTTLATPASVVQIGNDAAKQRSTIDFDDVSLTTGA